MQQQKNDGKEGNNFVGIHFKCCNIYRRIYRNKEGTAYSGRCPKCGARVHLAIGKGGTNSRFFTAN